MLLMVIVLHTLKLSSSNTHYIEGKQRKKENQIFYTEKKKNKQKSGFLSLSEFVSTQDNFSSVDRHHTCTKIPLEKKSHPAKSTNNVRHQRHTILQYHLLCFLSLKIKKKKKKNHLSLFPFPFFLLQSLFLLKKITFFKF